MKSNKNEAGPKSVVKSVRMDNKQNDWLKGRAKAEKLTEMDILRRALDIGLPYGDRTPLEKHMFEMKLATWQFQVAHLERKEQLASLRDLGSQVLKTTGPSEALESFAIKSKEVLEDIEKEVKELKEILRTYKLVDALDRDSLAVLRDHAELLAGMCCSEHVRRCLISISNFLRRFGGL